MTNLLSTQPAAFDALLGLLRTAGSSQSPPVQVFDTEIVQYQPSAVYVILEALEQHEFEPAALGSFAFYEDYEICGKTTMYQGMGDPATTTREVRDAVFLAHQNVVQATVTANSGSPATGGGAVLGAQAPAELEWVVPVFQRYSASPGEMAGGQAGLQGTIEWRFAVHARITAT